MLKLPILLVQLLLLATKIQPELIVKRKRMMSSNI